MRVSRMRYAPRPAPSANQAPKPRQAQAFRVLATCSAFEPGFRGGGVVRSMAAVVDTLPDHIDLTLVTSDHDIGATHAYPGLSGRWITRSGARIFYLGTRHIGQWSRLWREIHGTRYHLLYVNSLFSPGHSIIPLLAIRLGLIRGDNLLIAPRGELGRGALALKSRKKRIFLSLWRPLVTGMRPIWHASTEEEAADVSSVFPGAIVEIGLDQHALPIEPLLPDLDAATATTKLVFISRVVPKKNLDLSLLALASIERPVIFDIYGPLEDARYWARCQSLIADLPGHVVVRYHGELAPNLVRETFRQYDAFVFPTASENFGHVIAEALSASCPVICSDQTRWTDLLRAGGGAVADLTVASLSAEITRTAAMSVELRRGARFAAGEAYRRWRAGNADINILEKVRHAPWRTS
jgi:glycosyltransferase involved in cell wall biosynthesis